MARLFGVLGCLVVLAALFEGSSAQTTHIVLDDMGWVIPFQGGAPVYTAWAANKTFLVGDTLFFNFTTGQHDVAELRTRTAFDSCTPTPSSTIGPVILNGPATVTLNSTGEHYYICTVGPHCTMGQKLAINVTPRSSPPLPSPTDAPTATPPQASGPTAAGPTSPTAGSPAPSLAPTSSPTASTTPPPSSGPSAAGPTSPTAGSPAPSLAPTSGPTASGSPPPSYGPSAAGPTTSTGSPPSPSIPTDGPTSSTTPPQTTGPAAAGPTTNDTPSPPNSASFAVSASRFVGAGSVILVALSLVV